MTEPMTKANARELPTYREMAASCRKMAATSHRPAPLLMRAQTFEAIALALEGGEKQTEIG